MRHYGTCRYPGCMNPLTSSRATECNHHTRTCPEDHEGCGRTLELNQKNFYMKRKINDSGKVSIGWSSRCRECECAHRKRVRKSQQRGYKQREMETIPAMQAFLYGR